MKNNLVPTQIVNKNGVRTTVHKRDTGASSPAAALPAPDLSVSARIGKLSAVERATMVDELCALFESTHKKYKPFSIGINPDDILAFRNRLAAYRDEVISRLHANSQPQTGDNKAFLYVNKGASEEDLMNYLVLSEGNLSHERLFELGKGYCFNLRDAVRSLHAYPQLTYECTEDYFQKVIALTGVVTAIQSEQPNERHWESHENGRLITYTPAPRYGKEQLARLTSDDLIDLILEQPERWEQIADIVAARGTDDTILIRSVLDSETQSIRDGLL
jgi:hypothetical protein